MTFALLLGLAGCASDDTGMAKPDSADGTGLPWLTVVPGNRHACGVRSNGRAYCWGEGERGSEWTKDRVLSDVPTRDDLVDVSMAVKPETNVACALTSTGSVVCWGVRGAQEFPGPYSAMTVGELAVFGLRDDGSVDCYFPPSREPCMEYTRLEDVERLAADEGLVMAVTSKGELSGSTYGSYGAQIPELPLGPWSRISRPGSTVGWMCAVRVDGTPLCFGDPELDGHGLDATPDFVAADVCVVEFYGACALDIDGRPICWGEDIDFSPPSGPFAKLSCGDATWCGITPQGEATCWGDCDSGICDLPP